MLGRRPPSKNRSKEDKRQAAREADAIYRVKQRGAGIPSVREFADVLACEVMRSNKSDTAETIVERACERLLRMIDDTTKQPKWTKEGVLFRYQYCYRQMEIACASEQSVA